MTIGEKIRYFRENQKMGQEHLAALSHISVSAIRKYESGERIPKESQIEKLAIALHVNPSALVDFHFEKFSELLPYLYEIGRWGDIQFSGEKDAEGHYTEDSLTIRFTNPDIMNFLKDWADKKEECTQIQAAAQTITDQKAQDLMLNRIAEIEKDIESELVSKRISNDIYTEFLVPDNYPSKAIIESTAPLQTYADFLHMLNDLARTNIQIEFFGIFERIWDARAIITMDADSLEKEKMSSWAEDCYARFLYYFMELKKKKISTETFGYQENGKRYYRYIIKDRTLASAMSIIQEVMTASWESFSDEEKATFDKEICERINKFDEKLK